MTDTTKDLKALYDETAKKIGKPAFVEASQAAFDGCPLLQRIEWSQGTPSFNDGDPCTFSVHSPEFFGAEDEELCTYTYKDRKAVEGVEALHAFEAFLCSSVVEDLSERVFGDGAKISIARDGTVTEDEYYCD